jgi:hypothetical protein
LAFSTRALGWRKEEVDIFKALVAEDFEDCKIRAYFPNPDFLRKP